jgi:sigma-B regulation protein RsbU (phosphoserine phosphatase)
MKTTIRKKMIALIALPTLVIYVGMLGVMMVFLRGEARRDVEHQMTRLAGNYAARFDGAFREAAAVATATARFMETRPDLTEAEIFAQLTANTLQNPVIYGAAMAFEPGTFRSDDSLFCPYVYRGPDKLVQMNIDREDLDWYGQEKWQWWHIPKRTGRGVWTDPYFDEGAGNVLMVTYSEPFTRDGEFRGVTTVDIGLPTLQESIGFEILGDLRFAIMTVRGQYVYSPRPEDIMSRTVFEVFEERGRPDVIAAARRVVSGESGVVALDGWDTPEKQWVFFAPIESTGWGLAVVILEREVLAGVRARMAEAGLSMAVTLILIIACIWFVSGRIARPIARLRSKVLQIAGGDLEARVEGITSHDEIGELAESFNQMTADLRTHVDHLAEERASREKIERDLDLAREIQRGLLPKDDPRAPGFEIAGWNQAADKTGGDYFDWLELPDGRTIVTLADVTGHGIGPALIVAVCRAYMRASASTGHVDLAGALSRVNDLLHEDIPEGKFVTAVVGLIDPPQGRMTLVSAGQAPILFYEAKTDTVHNWDADDLPLGIMSGIGFDEAREVDFAAGDVLVLTTDGFFEWPNPSGEQYGTTRLVEFLQAKHQLEPQKFIDELHQAVLAHADGTVQGDDLTAVIIKKT